jgi:hypothetical protein
MLLYVKGLTMRSKWFAQYWAHAFRKILAWAGLALVLVGTSGPAWALPPPATPEIDPGSTVSALALLVGGMFVLTDRLRRK